MPLLAPEPQLYPSDLFSQEGAVGAPWWAAYVRSRQEKRLARHLLDGGVPFYLPQYPKDHDAGGRLRSSYLPLFPGYVFFRATGEQRQLALRSNVIVTTLEVADQPLLESELGGLWRLQESGAQLVPHPYLGPGDSVRITDGPFKGLTGTVLREKGQQWLVVSVTLLRRAVAAELERAALEPQRPTSSARRTAAARA